MSQDSKKYIAMLETLIQHAKDAGDATSVQNDDVNVGMSMAYYDLLNVAIEQAELLGISPSEIGLLGYSPESLLMKKAA